MIRRLLWAVMVTAPLAVGLTATAAPAHVASVDRGVDQVVTVRIRDNVFTPSTLSIAEGTAVRWVNAGRNRHNVTPNSRSNPSRAYGSGNLKPGESYVRTFDTGGTFAYYCTLHGTPTSGQRGELAVGDAVSATPVVPIGAGDAPAPHFRASGRTIRVPADAPTIQGAVDRAKTGDLVLVSPGVYDETVTVGTDGIVIRGVDRNRTILDGKFERDNGVLVAGANGVAVENLIARNFKENGFFWNGVLGYRGSYLTAYRNGDYGIYAYDSQYGQFDHSYASGSPDSGFYIGQCNPCHAVVTDVVSEYNQLGYSGTNSSGDLWLVNSVWTHNRAGIVPNTLDSEELPPQGMATIAGNLVGDNGDPDAAHTTTAAFDPVFGGGIVLVGSVGDVVAKNRVVDSAKIGIALAPNPGIETNTYQSRDNQVTGNVVERSGLADLAAVLPSADGGDCFAGNTFATSAPTDIERAMPCGGAPGDLTTGALDIAAFLDPSTNPKGRSYRTTPVPKAQRNMPRAATAKARPAGAPPVLDLADISVPAEW